MESLPPRWHSRYSPVDHIDSSIYDDIMSPITLSELSDTLMTLLTYKATGPSEISYEFLKLLPPLELSVLLHIFNDCLLQNRILED